MTAGGFAAADWLNTIQDCQRTGEFRRLDRKLRDHGLWDPTDSPQQG